PQETPHPSGDGAPPQARRPVFVFGCRHRGSESHSCVPVKSGAALTRVGHREVMAERAATENDPPAAATPRVRRLWGVRLVVLAATAAALGMPQTSVARSQAAGAT